jgi:hypothetical protein
MVPGAKCRDSRVHSAAKHDRLAKREPRLRAVPFNEFVDGMPVTALSIFGCETVQNRRFGLI